MPARDSTRRALTPEQLKLSNALALAHEQQGVRSVLVTSLDEGAGVTSVCVALARGLSWDQKQKVLLLEANLYHPCLQRIFNLTAREEARTSFEHYNLLKMAMATGSPNLQVIAVGKGISEIVLEPRRLAAALPALHDSFDFIVIDAPSVSLNPEIVLLSAHVDRVVLVVEEGRTRIQKVETLIAELVRARAELLGIVLNRESKHLPDIVEKWL